MKTTRLRFYQPSRVVRVVRKVSASSASSRIEFTRHRLGILIVISTTALLLSPDAHLRTVVCADCSPCCSRLLRLSFVGQKENKMDRAKAKMWTRFVLN